MSLRRNFAALIGVSLLAVGLIGSHASAQGGSGLQLSPTRSEISANPGEQKTFTIALKNITQSKLSTQVSLNDFESDNVSGTPKILVDTNNRTPYTLSKMIKGLKNVELAPGETKEIKATIDIPANAAPGAYFGAVRYAVVPQNNTDSERQIALNASVAHLVLVEVPGDVVQQIQVQSLDLQKQGKAHKFFFNRPDQASLSVKNLGNGFSRPFGRVTINNGFGKEVFNYEVNNNDPKSIVLPNSSRVFTNEVGGVSLPGKYTATASIAYGNGAEVVNYKSSFWYMPIWFLAIIFALILVIVVIAYLIYRKKFSTKSYKKN